MEYYIELPQSPVNLVNGAGNPHVLSTYTGPADLRTLSTVEIHTIILGPCVQDHPVTLVTPDFNLPSVVRTNEVSMHAEITKKVPRFAFNQICATLFTTLCPNYTSQPHAAVDVIKQSYIDPDGQRVSISVFAYHMRMTLAMCPFVADAMFPVSVCNKFMQGLDPRILSYFEQLYPAHSDPHDLDGHIQREKLHAIYMAAIQAENTFNITTAAARDAVGATPQSYCTAVVPAHASQAEKTLQRYDSSSPTSSPSSGMRGKCFGCKSPDHLWMDQKGNIICPKKNDPGIKAAADKAYARWTKNSKKFRMRKAAENIDFESMPEKARDKLRKQVYASDAASVALSVTSPPATVNAPSPPASASSSANSPQSRVHQTFLMEVITEPESIQVGAHAAPARCTLPAPVPLHSGMSCCLYDGWKTRIYRASFVWSILQLGSRRVA